VYLNSVLIVAWQTIHRAGLTYQLITSPWYPQSNGQAEQTVHTVKRLLTKSTDRYWAIAQLPYPGATSAQLSFWWGDESWPLSLYPMSIWSPSGPTGNNDEYKGKQKWQFDKRHRVNELPMLSDDMNIWISSQGEPVQGRVLSSADTPRSYVIDMYIYPLWTTA